MNLCLCITSFGERLLDNLKLEKLLRDTLGMREIRKSWLDVVSEELKKQALEVEKVENVCGVKFGIAKDHYNHASEIVKNVKSGGDILPIITEVEFARKELRRNCKESLLNRVLEAIP